MALSLRLLMRCGLLEVVHLQCLQLDDGGVLLRLDAEDALDGARRPRQLCPQPHHLEGDPPLIQFRIRDISRHKEVFDAARRPRQHGRNRTTCSGEGVAVCGRLAGSGTSSLGVVHAQSVSWNLGGSGVSMPSKLEMMTPWARCGGASFDALTDAAIIYPAPRTSPLATQPYV